MIEMTGLSWAVAVGILLTQAVKWAGDALNLRSLAPAPPPGYGDVYDGDKYARSQRYTREKTRFGYANAAAGLAVLIGFWFFGGFGALDGWTTGRTTSEMFRGLLYIGMLSFGKDALFLPFGLYGTFVIEARYGFNRTTVKTFVLDRLKTYALGIALGGPTLALVLWLFARLGAHAWLWGWAAVTTFSLALQFVAPTWILPLYNKFTPLPEGELRRAIFDLAGKLKYPLTNVFVMDGSKRSAKGNAFFTGFGRNKRIALFDTLIEKHTVPELVAVLAHEIGHHRLGHVWKGFLLGAAQTGGMFFLLSLALRWPALFEAFGIGRMSVHAGLVVFGVLFTPASFLLGLPLLAFSRRNELEADRYARNALGASAALAAGLRKLSADSLVNLTPHPFYVRLHYTHPPLVQRLKDLA